jgi:hypothetical protein
MSWAMTTNLLAGFACPGDNPREFFRQSMVRASAIYVEWPKEEDLSKNSLVPLRCLAFRIAGTPKLTSPAGTHRAKICVCPDYLDQQESLRPKRRSVP